MTNPNQALSDKFSDMVSSNKGIIYKVANLYCHDIETRKDLVQEIIYQLWRSYPKYNDTYKVSTWMYTISINVAISSYRKQSKRDTMYVPITETENTIAIIEGNEMDEKVSLLYQFINELKELDKALMFLYLESHSYTQIAEIMGISETNVATKISRNKEKLKLKFTNFKNK